MQSNSRSDDGDATLSIRVAQTLDSSSSFVEGRESRAQVCWVTAVGRHLGKTS